MQVQFAASTHNAEHGDDTKGEEHQPSSFNGEAVIDHRSGIAVWRQAYWTSECVRWSLLDDLTLAFDMQEAVSAVAQPPAARLLAHVTRRQ